MTATRPFLSFKDIFKFELEDIAERRKAFKSPPLSNDRTQPSTRHNLVGISLSGGGIRAASFSLGVLQSLTTAGIVDRIDYMSTVSGGGYIGCFLSSLLSQNAGNSPFGKKGEIIGDTPEIRHIRDNSRYLIYNGFPAVVSAIGAYLRGLVVSFFTLIPMLLTISAAILVTAGIRMDVMERLHNVSEHDWLNSFADLEMPISAILGCVLIIVWLIYTIVVSAWRTAPLEKRRQLAWIAGTLLFFYMGVVLLELHAWITSDPALPTYLHNLLGAKFSALWPLATAGLPFIKTLSSWVEGKKSSTRSRLTKRIVGLVGLALLSAIVPFGLWILLFQFSYWGNFPATAPLWLQNILGAVSFTQFIALKYVSLALFLFAFWPFLSVNANSLHQVYRDRLGRAFLIKRPPGAAGAFGDFISNDEFKLSQLSKVHTPYHLINTALNVPGSKVANLRGRNAEFFIFSRRFIGSNQTGFVNTVQAEDVVDRLTLGTAMAISGAAAAPNMGMASVKPLSPTLAFLNFRLGRWFEHPDRIASATARTDMRNEVQRFFARRPSPRYLLREAFFKSGLNLERDKAKNVQDSRFVFLTDGGHLENLGLYELLRRRCRIILAVDAEADPRYTLPAFAQLQRFATIDMSIRIIMDWRPIADRTRATKQRLAKHEVLPQRGPHVAIGLIEYPPGASSEPEFGALIYIKPSLSGDEPDYVLRYTSDNPDFPHESTADQFFSEEQLEVYRALGAHCMERFLSGKDAVSCYAEQQHELQDILQEMLPAIRLQGIAPSESPHNPIRVGDAA